MRPAPGAARPSSATTARCSPRRAGLALAVTTDMLVEGTHFLRRTPIARRLGHKALAVNLSDLAAMGADPRWVLLAARAARGRRAVARRVRRGHVRARRRAPGRARRRRHDPRSAHDHDHRDRHAAARLCAPPRCGARRARTCGSRARPAKPRSASRTCAAGCSSTRPPRRSASCASRRPSRASSSAGGCAGSRPRRSTFPTGCSRTSGTSPGSRRSAPRSTTTRCRGPPRSRPVRTAASPTSACSAAGTTTSSRSLRRRGSASEVERAGRAAGVAVARIGRIVAGPPEARVLAGGKPVAAARRGFDHFR